MLKFGLKLVKDSIVFKSDWFGEQKNKSLSLSVSLSGHPVFIYSSFCNQNNDTLLLNIHNNIQKNITKVVSMGPGIHLSHTQTTFYVLSKQIKY